MKLIRPKAAMTGSASVAWLALMVGLSALALVFWSPGELTLPGPQPAPAVVQATGTVAAGEATADTGQAAQLSTRIAALEDILPDVTVLLEQEKARGAQAAAEREQLRRLYEQTLQDSVALAALDIEPLLDQAQRLLADGSPIQAPIGLLTAAHERAARAESDALKPLLDALDQDRRSLQVIAQRSVAKAADDLHRLALGLNALPLQSQSGSGSSTDAQVDSTAAAPASEQAESQSGWLDRLVKSSSELIELPDAASREAVVRVTEVGESDLGVLPPSAAYYLMENLRLRLLSARLSLLMHDRPGFDADRQRALRWLKDHFDLTDERTQQAVQLLESLQAMARPQVDMSLAGSRQALESLTAAEPSR